MMTAQAARASPGILRLMTQAKTESKKTAAKGAIDIFKPRNRLILIVFGIVIIALIAITVGRRGDIARHPNMVSFCNAYHVSRGSDDLTEKVKYLRALEQYAPNDIYPTIHKMRVTYEQAEKQPNNYFGLEMGITGSIDNFNSYTSNHCDQ